MADAPRDLGQRLRDTRAKFENDLDTWVSTADGEGHAYLVPLSFYWDDTAFYVSTPRASITSRNLLASGGVRLGFGPTRDVVMVDGTAEAVDDATLAAGLADAFAAGAGFDPRELTTAYQYFRIVPRRVQAWREANELAGRDLMRDGHWLG